MGKSDECFILRREYVASLSSLFKASAMSGKNVGVQALLCTQVEFGCL